MTDSNWVCVRCQKCGLTCGHDEANRDCSWSCPLHSLWEWKGLAQEPGWQMTPSAHRRLATVQLKAALGSIKEALHHLKSAEPSLGQVDVTSHVETCLATLELALKQRG